MILSEILQIVMLSVAIVVLSLSVVTLMWNLYDKKKIKGALIILHDSETDEDGMYLESYLEIKDIAGEKKILVEIKNKTI